MNCYIKFWEDGNIITEKIYTAAKIKIGPFIEFETEIEILQVPIENVIEIYFE